jgi:hypothetical protein
MAGDAGGIWCFTAAGLLALSGSKALARFFTRKSGDVCL